MDCKFLDRRSLCDVCTRTKPCEESSRMSPILSLCTSTPSHVTGATKSRETLRGRPLKSTGSLSNSRQGPSVSRVLFVICCVLVYWTCNCLSMDTVYSEPVKVRAEAPQRLTAKHGFMFLDKITSEQELPECAPWAVCNKVDTYSSPRIEKQCRCRGRQSCSTSLASDDGHTVADKSRQFKICQPVAKLATCRFFRDVTWTVTSHSDNTTSQTVHCICPKNSVAYIFKHKAFQTEAGTGYKYLFACSPESRLRCQRKEPCRLFTVRKRPDHEEVNTNTLCQCPRGSYCPAHHSEPSVIRGSTYPLDHIKTFTGFCSFQSKHPNQYHKNLQSLF